MLQRYSYEEILLQRIWNLTSLYPHYWSELLLLAEQFLTDEQREELHSMIFDVEKLVLETEVIPRVDENGKLFWVERIRGKLSLYDIEMAIESNPDYYAYFQREDGTIVTKFDVERELNRIKGWLFAHIRQRASSKRFSKFR